MPEPTDTTTTLHLAWLENDLETQVARGENAGRRLTHEFVVRQYQAQAHTANNDLSFNIPALDNKQAVAVWFTNANEQVIQACGLPLADS